MTKIRQADIGKRFSRPEGWWKIYHTASETVNRVNILDTIDYIKQTLVFRTIEAGSGIRLELVDTDNPFERHTPYQKIRVSVDTSTLSFFTTNIGIYRENLFLGNVSALDFKNAIVSVSGGKAFIEILVSGASNHNILVNNVTANSVPITNVNFEGPVSANEISPGYVNVAIEAIDGIHVSVDGSSYPSTFQTINFTGRSSAISMTSGGIVNVDLNVVGGISEVQIQTIVYTGSVVTSGNAVISAFFGSYNPNPNNVIVTINGLMLSYNSNSALSDFEIQGSNLILNINNIGYSLDPNDKIVSYYYI